MRKRKWHYVLLPMQYGVFCKKSRKHKTWWSEFEGMIWCYKCKKDMSGTLGIFGGPIPICTTQLMLGENCFDRVKVATGKIKRFSCKSLTDKV